VKKFICLLLVAISYLLVTPATTYATSNLVVMSRNIYLGADVGKALALIPDLPHH
jgi:hypothetical protein